MPGIIKVCLPRGYLGHSTTSPKKWYMPIEGRVQYLKGVAKRQAYDKSIAIWEYCFCGSGSDKVPVTFKQVGPTDRPFGPPDRGFVIMSRKRFVRPHYQDKHTSLELRPLQVKAMVLDGHANDVYEPVHEFMVCLPKRDSRVDDRVLLLKGPVKKRRRGHEAFAAPGNYWTVLEDEDLFTRDQRDARRYRQLGAMKRPA